MQALTRAADRNVKVRIYLDGAQLAERDQSKVFRVEIRTKRKPSALMHLKSYQIDGRLLRTGAANFSASGLKRQDNDLIAVSLDPVRFAHVRRESPGPGGGRAEPLNPAGVPTWARTGDPIQLSRVLNLLQEPNVVFG